MESSPDKELGFKLFLELASCRVVQIHLELKTKIWVETTKWDYHFANNNLELLN